MASIDRVLWFAESALIPLSFCAVALAVFSPSTGRCRFAVLLCLFVALTVAQPLGLIATKVDGPVPPGGQEVDADAPHVAHGFGGVPLLPFAIYPRDDPELLAAIEENRPSQTIRARSWLFLPILTNSAKIADNCGTIFEPPCWYVDSSTKNARSVRLYEDDGTYWVVAHDRATPGDAPYADPRPAFVWRLRIGVASPLGVIYWLLVPLLIFTAYRLNRDAVPGSAEIGDGSPPGFA